MNLTPGINCRESVQDNKGSLSNSAGKPYPPWSDLMAWAVDLRVDRVGGACF